MITCMDFVATSTVPTKSPSTRCNAPCTIHGSVSTITMYYSTLHQKKPVMPYIAICYHRVLYITIGALCCTKCINSIMASKAYPPYL